MAKHSQFDLIVIGAGINGAGIARDATMRGLRVLLIDKSDLGGGTSSYSTRLIHGGLRYLEHGELGLVRESLRERETLLRIAPHLVHPIPILIPIYRRARRGRTAIRLGMLAYDLLSIRKSLPRHQMLSREEALSQSPGLEQKDLIGAALYYDAQVEFAERLVLENALDAKAHGAEVLTYARVHTIEGQLISFTFEESHHVATGEVIVNAAGPWVDELFPESQRLIGGTKGSHLIVNSFAGAPTQAIYVEAESDGRPFFVIPWNSQYLIGTTDDRFEGDLDQVRCEKWEVDYLLNETNRAFPGAKLKRTDVCYTYSGVRPLPFAEKTEESGITRRHFIREHNTNTRLLSIVGGKLTTYRRLAEECVDLVFDKLRKRSPTCETQVTPLPGAYQTAGLRWPTNFSDVVRLRLAKIYGSRVQDLIDLCRVQPSLSETFNSPGDALMAEVVFAFESEIATTLTDCLMRRTMVGLSCDSSMADAEAAAETCKKFLGWSEERVRRELTDFQKHVELMSVP